MMHRRECHSNRPFRQLIRRGVHHIVDKIDQRLGVRRHPQFVVLLVADRLVLNVFQFYYFHDRKLETRF